MIRMVCTKSFAANDGKGFYCSGDEFDMYTADEMNGCELDDELPERYDDVIGYVPEIDGWLPIWRCMARRG